MNAMLGGVITPTGVETPCGDTVRAQAIAKMIGTFCFHKGTFALFKLVEIWAFCAVTRSSKSTATSIYVMLVRPDNLRKFPQTVFQSPVRSLSDGLSRKLG